MFYYRRGRNMPLANYLLTVACGLEKAAVQSANDFLTDINVTQENFGTRLHVRKWPEDNPTYTMRNGDAVFGLVSLANSAIDLGHSAEVETQLQLRGNREESIGFFGLELLEPWPADGGVGGMGAGGSNRSDDQVQAY